MPVHAYLGERWDAHFGTARTGAAVDCWYWRLPTSCRTAQMQQQLTEEQIEQMRKANEQRKKCGPEL